MARGRIELDAKVVEKLKVVLAGLASDVACADREVVEKLMEALGKAEAVEEKPAVTWAQAIKDAHKGASEGQK